MNAFSEPLVFGDAVVQLGPRLRRVGASCLALKNSPNKSIRHSPRRNARYQESAGVFDCVSLPISPAKRYRVDTEKLQKAVAAELAAKREKDEGKSKTEGSHDGGIGQSL